MKKKDHSLLFIFITIFIDITGLGIIIPVIPALISELIDGSISEAAKYSGWLMFSYASLQFLFAPILGGLSDQFGRRPVILLSLFGFGINYLVLAFAPTITWLFFGRVFQGIMGASLTTASAYIADISSPEKKAPNFGLIGAAFGLGFILGPVIGGYLGQFGSRIPFIAAAIFTLINLIYGYFILPESLKKNNRRKFDIKRANPIGTLFSLKRYPVISGLLICIVLFNIAQHATQSTWTFFTIEKFNWGEDNCGLFSWVYRITSRNCSRWVNKSNNSKIRKHKKCLFWNGLLYSGFDFNFISARKLDDFCICNPSVTRRNIWTRITRYNDK